MWLMSYPHLIVIDDIIIVLRVSQDTSSNQLSRFIRKGELKAGISFILVFYETNSMRHINQYWMK